MTNIFTAMLIVMRRRTSVKNTLYEENFFSVLATGPKVAGSNPAEDDGF
jgi:hypothetical protein